MAQGQVISSKPGAANSEIDLRYARNQTGGPPKNLNGSLVMVMLRNPLDQYHSRRKDLIAQLDQSKASATRAHLQRAVDVTDATFATVTDILAVLQSLALATREQAEKHQEAAAAAAPDFRASLEKLPDSNDPAFQQSRQMLERVAQLKASSAANGLHVAFVQLDMLRTVCAMWLDVLDDLYRAADRAAVFARIEKIIEFVASKLPVAGNYLEALKLAADLYAVKKAQAKSADDYFASLESYIDAADIYLEGATSFCVQVQGMLGNGRIEQVRERAAAANNPPGATA